jgi:hypothetical protein
MASIWISPEIAPATSGWLAARAQAPARIAEPAERFLLRRSGGRPVSFSGMLMVEHSGAGIEGERCHVIRLYETVAGTIVIEVVLGAGNDACLPHAIVAEVDSIDGARAFLASYDPSAEASGTSGSIVAQALRLETEGRRIKADFDACRKAVFAAFDDTTQDAEYETRTN